MKAQLSAARPRQADGSRRRDSHDRSPVPYDRLLELQASAGNAAVGVLLARRGQGQPLPPQLRGEMEGRLATDLGSVRVHTDPAAASAVTALGAKAVSVGEDIAFAEGRFAPATTEGRRLVGHELAHVIQQRRGGSMVPAVDGTGPLETEAGRAGEALAATGGTVTVLGHSAVGPAADPEDEREGWGPGALWDAARETAGAAWSSLEERVEAARDYFARRLDEVVLEQAVSMTNASDGDMRFEDRALEARVDASPDLDADVRERRRQRRESERADRERRGREYEQAWAEVREQGLFRPQPHIPRRSSDHPPLTMRGQTEVERRRFEAERSERDRNRREMLDSVDSTWTTVGPTGEIWVHSVSDAQLARLVEQTPRYSRSDQEVIVETRGGEVYVRGPLGWRRDEGAEAWRDLYDDSLQLLQEQVLEPAAAITMRAAGIYSAGLAGVVEGGLVGAGEAILANEAEEAIETHIENMVTNPILERTVQDDDARPLIGQLVGLGMGVGVGVATQGMTHGPRGRGEVAGDVDIGDLGVRMDLDEPTGIRALSSDEAAFRHSSEGDPLGGTHTAGDRPHDADPQVVIPEPPPLHIGTEPSSEVEAAIIADVRQIGSAPRQHRSPLEHQRPGVRPVTDLQARRRRSAPTATEASDDLLPPTGPSANDASYGPRTEPHAMERPAEAVDTVELPMAAGHDVRSGARRDVRPRPQRGDQARASASASASASSGGGLSGAQQQVGVDVASQPSQAAPATGLGGRVHEPINPSRQRNRYPGFTRLEPWEAEIASTRIAELNQLLGGTDTPTEIPADRALAAPWLGASPISTAEGWARYSRRYWTEFSRQFPEDYALMGPGHTVTPELAQRWRLPESTIGQALEHHHVMNGTIVIPVPEGLHGGPGTFGRIHRSSR